MIEDIVSLRKRGDKLKEKITKSKNPALIEEMASHFNNVGIYLSTSDQIRDHLLSVMPEDQVPTAPVIRKVMKDTFALKYKTLSKANVKYKDPLFNEKRLWVSRLLG